MALVALGVLVSVLLWVCTYRVLCLLNSRCSAEWNCRLVTAAHGVLITCLSYKNGFIDNRWPFTDPGLPNSQYEEQIIVLCLGYFLFDFSWCVYHGTEGMVMLTHHCASIFGLAAALILGVSGTDVIGVIFGAELTNPFLQLRWFFKETGRYRTLPAEINDLLFISLFAGVRIGVGGYFFYTEWTNKRPLMLFKLGGTALYIVSWVFMVQIGRFAVRKYTRMYREWRDKSTSYKMKVSYSNGDVNNVK
ncbi:PREDICTED: transmembrane protein 136-like [Branchiostoma belcheri]|uniref:Transmembrane protein 136-like n=1 Tax=Branchiostoma belcheri TaxID=7741 RepID=A0A6P4XN80_BRABE|nr:PREDICTED: transmembrane protein 136-like [Branchiostoma belcheri]